MSIITWDDAYSVNVREIDEQHKKFFEIVNELHDSLVSARGKEYFAMTKKTLKALRDYTRYHFSSEEKYMQKINYPDLAAHKKNHDRFYVRIMELYNDVQEGKMVLNTEIMKTVANWLQEHVLSEDMKYCQFAAAGG